MATNPLNNLQNVDTSLIGTSATSRGTKIRKPNETMDKNAFLKILAAELSNQDPSKPTDNTAYVSQMAQFASIEQAANLNSNMRFTGAAALIGKNVLLNSADEKGKLYHGKIKGVSKDGDTVKINVIIGETTNAEGKICDVIKQFKVEDILELIETIPENSGNNNGSNSNNVNNNTNNNNTGNDLDNDVDNEATNDNNYNGSDSDSDVATP